MAQRKRRNTKKPSPKPAFNFRALLSFVKKLTLALVVVSFLGVLGFYSLEKFNVFVNKPIEQLVIKGDFFYTDTAKIEKIIYSSANQSFVKEHLESIRQALVASPWIDDASLTRRWPNTLEVSIREHKAIARWGDTGFVNFRGELVKTTALDKLKNLPLLYGADTDAAEVMRQYKTLTPLLLNSRLAIDSLHKDILGVWQLTLSNDWQLVLGRNGLSEKVQTIAYVLSQKILRVDDAVNTIDMRYENGFAIAWDKSVKTVSDNQYENTAKKGAPS